MSAVKQTTFEEYHNTFSTMLKHIDAQFSLTKNRQKNLPVWSGHTSYKEFLNFIEKTAIKHTAEELGIATNTTSDRWRVLTLPFSVYSAMEEGRLTFSKAKIMTAINFDPENDSDIKVAEEIVNEVVDKKLTNPQIKELVQSKNAKVWNSSDIIMHRLAEQHGLNSNTKC